LSTAITQRALARELRADFEDVTIIARRCFEWVRDEIQHSGDFELNPVTCTASDVLEQRSGFCYAKSHPLAALLRANGIPAGFCYQRLRAEEHGLDFCLHGPSDVYHPSAMS
jgi:transglutaminase-like putative cysteine protease